MPSAYWTWSREWYRNVALEPWIDCCKIPWPDPHAIFVVRDPFSKHYSWRLSRPCHPWSLLVPPMHILRKYRWLSGGICSRCCIERRLTNPQDRPARSRPILAPRHDVEHNFCERVYEARLLSPPSPCCSANSRSFSHDIICELRNAKSCRASVSAFCFISRRFIASFIRDSRPRIVKLLSSFSLLLSSPRSLSSSWKMTRELCAARSWTVSLLIRWFFKLSWNRDWSVGIITLVSSTSFRKELETAYVSQTFCCTVLCITLMETASLLLVRSARLHSLLLSMSYCPSRVILNPLSGGPRLPPTLLVNCQPNTSTLAIWH